MNSKIFLFAIINLFAISAQGIDVDDIMGMFGELEDAGRILKTPPEDYQNFPLGIQKTLFNVPFTIALSNAKLHTNYAEVTMFLKVELPNSSKSLIFGADKVKLSYQNGLVGDVRLVLFKEVPIPLGNAGKILIKGKMDTTGVAVSETYALVDCNFNLKEISLDGEVQLNSQVFKKEGTNENDTVRAPFHLMVDDFNNWIVGITFPTIAFKSLPGMTIDLKGAYLDFSDNQNPANFSVPGDYLQKYFSLPDVKLWRGIYVDEFTLKLPPEFKLKGSSDRISIQANHLILDEFGLTAKVAATGLIPLERGDASGWPLSVEQFDLAFVANNLTALGFSGEIGLPVSKEARHYRALIGLGGDLLFEVSLKDTLNVDLFGAATAHLEKTSYVKIEKRGHAFIPSLVMDGYLEINGAKQLNLERFVFRRLTFSPEAPYLSAERFDYEGDVSMLGIPVTISKIDMQTKNDNVAICFDMKLNLMESAISARTSAKILANYKDGKWRFNKFQVEEIQLENISLAGFSLSGMIAVREDDPVYGNYFGGTIKACFSSLSDGLTLNVDAKFGRKDDFRYWYVLGDADFPTGIIIGTLSINGFSGGAYYRMKADAGGSHPVYIPDKSCSLGVRAGVSFAIGTKTAISGDALMEMNFLQSGGIGKIGFYGSASILNFSNLMPPNLKNLYNQSLETHNKMGESLADKLPKNVTSSDMAKSIYPAGAQQEKEKQGASISAYLTMEYDFTTRTFDSNFEVKINALGGLLRGVGKDNVAGWSHIYISPQTWFMHAGTPTNPVGVYFGFGGFHIETHTYFMVGNQIPPAPAPPQQVIDILKISPEEADYMKQMNVIGEGKGFAFGSHLSIDTGNMNFLILYARFQAGMGFDLMLKDYSGYICKETGREPGINGWYANGQVYAYLQGNLGVRIKLFLINMNIPIIQGSAAVLLQSRLPGPTWIGGYMAVNLNVLGGLVSGSMRMKMSFGDDCELIRADGEYSPVDMPMISDLTPTAGSEKVDVFTAPQAAFNMKVGAPFSVEDDEGTKTFRIQLKEFEVLDNKNNKIPGRLEWNSTKDAITFFSKEILPPATKMKAWVSVSFEQSLNGNWTTVSRAGKEAQEKKEVTFLTGDAPNYIPLSNIVYTYPVVDQKNYYPEELNTGYVQLKTGQSYLFPETFHYKVDFASETGEKQEAAFTYDVSAAKLNYRLPALNKSVKYHQTFAAYANNKETTASETAYRAETVGSGDDEAGTINYKQQLAQEVIKNGSLAVLEYDFSSGRHATFVEKMSSLQLIGRTGYVSTEVRSLVLETADYYELFDAAELTGTSYTGSAPLVRVEAILEDPYYKEDMAPLIYNWYPAPDIRISNRDENTYGVPPVRAFSLYQGYLNAVVSGEYNPQILKVLPFVYQLPTVYRDDYYDLRTAVVNRYLLTSEAKKWEFLVGSNFKFIRSGKYKARYQYVAPGEKRTGETIVEYENNIDWR